MMQSHLEKWNQDLEAETPVNGHVLKKKLKHQYISNPTNQLGPIPDLQILNDLNDSHICIS